MNIKSRVLSERMKSRVCELCRQHDVQALYVFGSLVRDKGVSFSEDSDIDFAVMFDYTEVKGSFDRYMSLKNALEDLLQRPVDLVSIKSTRNKYFAEEFEATKELLYAA